MQKRLFDPLGMKDTTFWPTEEQVKRLAKSYKPGKDNMGLEEIQITQLHYPLERSASVSRCRPAGCSPQRRTWRLFARCSSTAARRRASELLSEDAVRQMTSTQTGDLLNKGKGENGYGLGLSTTRKAREGGGHPRHVPNTAAPTPRICGSTRSAASSPSTWCSTLAIRAKRAAKSATPSRRRR